MRQPFARAASLAAVLLVEGCVAVSTGTPPQPQQVKPKMLPRLTEIERDLILRRKRAEEEQWLGEIEGIDMTLTFVRTKQADAARLAHRPPVALGIPTTRAR